MSQTKSHYESALHFYPELKASTHARARYHCFPEEIIEATPLDKLFSMIRDHEIELALQMEELAKSSKPKITYYTMEELEEEQEADEEERREVRSASSLRSEWMSSRGVF